MKQKLLWKCLLLCFMLLSCEKASKVAEITCTTGFAKEVTESRARLNGQASIKNVTGDAPTALFVYSESASEKEALLESGISVEVGTLPAEGGAFSAELSNLKDGVKYYYLAMLVFEGEKIVGDVKMFATPPHPIPKGAVDLGIMMQREDGSSYHLYWAECNIGADKPEDAGDYYAWGEVEPYYAEGHSQDNPCTHWREGKKGYSWESYRWNADAYLPKLTKYCVYDLYAPGQWAGEGSPDNKIVLETGPDGDDVASRLLGGTWRMPTVTEMKALRQCSWNRTARNGVNGWEVKSTVEGNTNSIFFPFAGRRHTDYISYGESWDPTGAYWTSSLFDRASEFAYHLSLGSGSVGLYARSDRYMGFPIRPVAE